MQIQVQPRQVQELLQTLFSTYDQIFEEDEHPAPQVMLMRILQFKQSEIEAERESSAQVLRHITEKNYTIQGRYISHASEKQIDQMANKKQRIMGRLIDMRVGVQTKLNHLQIKYDQLLGIAKDRMERIKTLQADNARLVAELNAMKVSLALQQKKAKRAEEKYETLQKQFDSFIQSSKKLNMQTKKFFEDYTKAIRNEILQKMAENNKKYNKFIDQLTQAFQKNQQQNSLKIKNLQTQNARLKKIVSQLIRDLSVAINFPKKQQETDETWLHQYGLMKEKQNQALNNASIDVRSNPQYGYNISDHKTYLQQTKRRLANIGVN